MLHFEYSRLQSHLACLLCLIASLIGQDASSQSMGNPAGLSPDTPGVNAAKPSADFANTQDKLFIRQAALGGRAEVELSKIAQQKASSTSVKDFAKRMVEEHRKSNELLLRTGKTRTEIPDELDPEHKTLRDELNGRPKAEFDQAYLTTQIADHQRTVNLLLWELSYGQNEPLKKYAMDQLPVVLDHLEHAKLEYATLVGALPRH
jgi:putative membrane protein